MIHPGYFNFSNGVNPIHNQWIERFFSKYNCKLIGSEIYFGIATDDVSVNRFWFGFFEEFKFSSQDFIECISSSAYFFSNPSGDTQENGLWPLKLS